MYLLPLYTHKHSYPVMDVLLLIDVTLQMCQIYKCQSYRWLVFMLAFTLYICW